ncbi:hypothetical protein N665_0799s0010 [Sinapis alba]|nr:hypothetical protein N665_0799s0010 [Sinapis alba]
MSSITKDRKEQMVIQSSIVLLQERFRRLQRTRELRAERELLNPKPNHQDKKILQYYNTEPSSFDFFQFLPLNSHHPRHSSSSPSPYALTPPLIPLKSLAFVITGQIKTTRRRWLGLIDTTTLIHLCVSKFIKLISPPSFCF